MMVENTLTTTKKNIFGQFFGLVKIYHIRWLNDTFFQENHPVSYKVKGQFWVTG